MPVTGEELGDCQVADIRQPIPQRLSIGWEERLVELDIP